MIFPEWAPQALVDRYNRNECYLENLKGCGREMPIDKAVREIQPVLLRLATDPEMERVWKKLYSTRKTQPSDSFVSKEFTNNNMAGILISHVQYALIVSQQDIKTRFEEETKYKNIAKATRKLSKLVKNSLLDVTPYRWLSNEAINKILELDIKPEKAVGMFCLIQDYDEYNKKGAIFSPSMMQKYGGKEKIEYWSTAESTREWFVRSVITPQYPGMSEILNNMALDADNIAKEMMTNERLAERPSIISKETIFIRSLYTRYWREEFGSPLRRTFAVFSKVALDNSNISASTIVDALEKIK